MVCCVIGGDGGPDFHAAPDERAGFEGNHVQIFVGGDGVALFELQVAALAFDHLQIAVRKQTGHAYCGVGRDAIIEPKGGQIAQGLHRIAGDQGPWCAPERPHGRLVAAFVALVLNVIVN